MAISLVQSAARERVIVISSIVQVTSTHLQQMLMLDEVFIGASSANVKRWQAGDTWPLTEPEHEGTCPSVTAESHQLVAVELE